MDKLSKRLKNTIIQWENIYGDWYTVLYDKNGIQIKPEKENTFAYECLRESNNILKVLKQIYNNKNYNIKNMNKRKYKLSK